jgi:hypothetical protein
MIADSVRRKKDYTLLQRNYLMGINLDDKKLLQSWQRFFLDRDIELKETATFYQFDCSYKKIVRGAASPEIFITRDDLAYILQFGPIEEIRYVNNAIRISIRRL